MNLVMWSGGIDSTAALYWLLEETSEPVHAHHIALSTPETGMRAFMEGEAVDAILRWMDSNCRPFEYSHSKIIRTMGCDNAAVGWMASQLCHDPRILRVVIGTQEDDTSRPLVQSRMRERELAFATNPNTTAKFWLPLIRWSKSEILDYLPRELRDLCWSCREPQHYKLCGRCDACIELNNAIQNK